jgi:Reverse transcriptase (RNA-dependent DNA polymerase)
MEEICYHHDPQKWKNKLRTPLPNAWRPITKSNTIPKLAASFLLFYYNFWILDKNIISPHQKAIGSFEGCHDHNAVVNIIRDDVRLACLNRKDTPKQAFFFFGDIKDAYGSVQHHRLFQILNHLGIDPVLLNLLKSLYSDNTTEVQIEGKRIGSMKINKGVKQGCTLSSLLFCIYINALIKNIETSFPNSGYTIGNITYKVIAYADDIVLVSNNKQDLQNRINATSTLAEKLDLHFQPTKCGILAIPAIHTNRTTPLYVNQIPIPFVSNQKPIKFLGALIDHKQYLNPHSKFDDLLDCLRKIERSDLYPNQKFTAYKLFLHSKIPFHL